MNEAGNRIKAIIDTGDLPTWNPTEIGEYRGLKLYLINGVDKRAHTEYYQIELHFPDMKYMRAVNFSPYDSPAGYFRRVKNSLIKLDEDIAEVKNKVDNLTRNIEVLSKEIEKPFPQQEELDKKLARLNEVDALLLSQSQAKNADSPSRQRDTEPRSEDDVYSDNYETAFEDEHNTPQNKSEDNFGIKKKDKENYADAELNIKRDVPRAGTSRERAAAPTGGRGVSGKMKACPDWGY